MKKSAHDNQKELSALKDQVQWLSNRLDIYEVAAKGANDGLWDWDRSNNQPFVSPPWKTMLGIDDAANIEINGLWESLLHPDDYEKATSYLNEFIESEKLDYQQEFRLRHTDGRYLWIRSKAFAIRDSNGKLLRLSGSHTDITSRKEADEARRKSEEKYKSLFGNSLVGMFRSDYVTGEFLETNDKFWKILKASRHDGYSALDFFKEESDQQRVIDLLRPTGGVENEEMEILRKDGTPIWISFNAKLNKEDGVLETIIVDITEKKKSFLELERVNFELDTFIYHASHDLRSPLKSILGLVNLYRLETSEEVKLQCVEKIQMSVLRLDKLIHDLLDISRNDRVENDKTEVNLLNEINNSINSYYNATNTQGLKTYVNIKHNKKFKTDDTRLRVILNNIISNAMKYRRELATESYIKISATVDEVKTSITIEDNGEGIEESKLSHIFDMFYRATEQSTGSGLGLYIVKKVAEKLEAQIDVNSVRGEGTTFHITIPNFYYK